MKKLPKFTFEYNDNRHRWNLENDMTGKIIKSFENKADGTARGVFKRILGEDGGSIKIQKINGRIQEERTYPKSRDPKKSEG